MMKTAAFGTTVVMLLACIAVADEIDWAGYISLEPRFFIDDPLFIEQPGAGVSPSAVVAPELRYAWNNGGDRLTVSAFARFDTDDDNRSHSDLREAYWQHTSGAWTWQVGLGRVFWGVTEARHLVDIVNQTDWVEDIDEEDKLGQPMIWLERWSADLGSFGIFLLPGFRERTFPAGDARLSGALPIDTDNAEYESSAEDRRLDWALRWSRALGNWDLGVSGFYGTAREPRFLPRLNAANEPVLTPRYDVIGQVGLDIQYTRNAWLWKLEVIGREGHGRTFGAFVAGLEYTLFDLADTGADLGLLVEYLFDDRDATAPPTFYEDDWFAGFRFALNDTEDTAILGGAMAGSDGTFGVVEAERRVGETWKLELELRLFVDVDASESLLARYQNDSFVTLRIARYF